jgi:O-antigen ligase
MDLTEKASKYFVNQERLNRDIDHFILFCFCVLLISLPIAHTETIRAFALGIPAGLWIMKMLLTRRLLFFRTFLDLPILMFSVIAALSILTAVDPMYSLEEFIGEWLIKIFLFYLVVNNFRPENLKYILGALLVGNILMVNYSIFEFFHRGGILFDPRVRVGSLHSGVGTFSTYLVTIIPYILIAVFFTRKSGFRLLLFVLLSLNFFALCLTYSRGSLITILILLIVMSYLFFSKKLVILSLVGIILVAGIVYPYYYKRFTYPPVRQEMPDSYQGRLILAKFSLKKILGSPFRMIGYGQRSFIKYFKEFGAKYDQAAMWHAHNTFLNIGLQTGIQGLIVFCFLLYRIICYCYKNWRFKKPALQKYYFLATLGMVIAFLVRNLSDDFFIDDSALLFWFLVGMGFADLNSKEYFVGNEGSQA